MTRRSESASGRPDSAGDREIDADLLLEREDLLENDLLRWIRALDLQVLGACRADERLNPLLKFTAAPAKGEDRLVSHLAQHFDAPEIGMLLRCLCLPLVSVRVGKVRKDANLLCPTNIRGHLNLHLLPSSNMRISFCGDDGCNERMAVIYNESFEEVSLEEISADDSGRSFFLKLPGAQTSYFWCSEKSKLLGDELLLKMKSLLQRKPSLSQLTGICQSRLDTFATNLRAYLLVSTNSAGASEATLNTDAPCTRQSDLSSQSPSTTSKSHHRSRQSASQSGKMYPYLQGNLSPKSNTFKDGASKSLSTLRNGIKEKFRRRGESNSSLLISSNHLVIPTSSSNIHPSCNNQMNLEKLEEATHSCASPSDVRISRSCDLLDLSTSSSNIQACDLLDWSSSTSSSSFFSSLPVTQLPNSSSPILSPYYCWCPPCSSPFQQTMTPPTLPPMSSDTLPLPPLSSLLSAAGSVSFLQAEQPLAQSPFPKFELPTVLPASFVAMSTSQKIPTFTPFMSDSIVHIPVIDVCSSGPGYLVSAGPSMSSTISPLLSKSLVDPLTKVESIVEKSARETLRMLISSTPSNQELMQVLPGVLSTTETSFQNGQVSEHDILVTGSRGIYTGVQDMNAIANSICLMDLTSSTRSKIFGDRIIRSENGQNNLETERRVQNSEGEDAKDPLS